MGYSRVSFLELETFYSVNLWIIAQAHKNRISTHYANYDSLITQIKTQLYEAVMRETCEAVKCCSSNKNLNQGDDYDRLIRFKPTTHRAKSF